VPTEVQLKAEKDIWGPNLKACAVAAAGIGLLKDSTLPLIAVTT
jgi:hypothetical protein